MARGEGPAILSKGVWGSAVASPSGDWGSAPNANAFLLHDAKNATQNYCKKMKFNHKLNLITCMYYGEFIVKNPVNYYLALSCKRAS